MPALSSRRLGALVLLFLLHSGIAPCARGASAEKKKGTPKQAEIDFENEDSFVDLSDALKSKQYVRRAILSTVIRTTSHFASDRYYINHLLGFNSVWQRKDGAQKYYAGIEGVSFGYVTTGGHAFEAGLELSYPSDVFVSYSYFIRPAHLSIWPFLGAGVGTEVKALEIISSPVPDFPYSGPPEMFLTKFGFLVPLVEVGLKVEFRINFYGTARLVFTSGLGAIFFL